MANAKFRKFELSDLLLLDINERHAQQKKNVLNSVIAMSVLGNEDAITMVVDGKVMACCGYSNGEVWAFLGKDLRRTMVALTRECQRIVDRNSPCRAWVDGEDPNAVRWIKMLGFKLIGYGYWEHA